MTAYVPSAILSSGYPPLKGDGVSLHSKGDGLKQQSEHYWEQRPPSSASYWSHPQARLSSLNLVSDTLFLLFSQEASQLQC